MFAAVTMAYCFLAIAMHITLCHAVPFGGSLGKFLIAGCAAGAGLLVHLRSMDDMEIAAGVLLYGLACEVYVFLFSMVSSSVSVALLLAFRGSGKPVVDLDGLCSSAGMVSRRVEKLVSSGLLIDDGGRYLITKKGRSLVRAFSILRLFFGHE